VRDFAAALRGLTVRGRSFVAAGAACAGSAVMLGEQDLLRVAVLLIGLPVFAAAFVSRTRYRLACTRRLDPPRVSAGGTVSVRIRLDNMSRLPSSVLLVEDSVPTSSEAETRFVLDRIEPGGTRDLSYELRAYYRGRYQLGPMTIRLADPFGFCELSRAFRSRDDLIVAPTIEKLPAARSGHASLASQRRRIALTGDDESTTRPYRSGDDLRRVHWRTTARMGELMIRREDRPQTGGATVLLDTRMTAWADEGPEAPFEWAVSAAGSVGVHLARGGYGVRLVTPEGLAATAPAKLVGPLLDELAVVTPIPATSLRPAYAAVSAGDGGTLVAVLGRTDPATAVTIAALRPRSAPAIAVLVDVTRWRADPAATADLEACQAALTRSGWAVLVGGLGTPLGELWPRVSRPTRRPGVAPPAAAVPHGRIR
jgi:uncharacterized protein (DUF58 family)